MALDLKETKVMGEGVWIKYDDDVSFKIRYLSPKAGRKLRKPLVKTKWRASEKVEEVNEQLFDDALIDYMVIDWKGIEFGGKKAECTLENKKKLTELFSDVAVFILESAKDHASFIEQKEATALKNSKSSSNSS